MVEDQLVSLGVNLLATGVTAGTGVGASKARGVLRRRAFSKELGDVATAFNASLKTAIAEENERLDSNEVAGVVDDWDAIATELARLAGEDGGTGTREKDQVSVLFEDEETAVAHIAEAIATVKGFDLDRTPELREALERAVTRAYREAIVEFEQRIAGTDLQDVFEAETGLVIVERLNVLQQNLNSLHSDVETLLTQGARDEGFVHLTPEYFTQVTLETPQTCWRTGFNHGEIKAGYHFERRHDDERTITDLLFERLQAGRNQVVIGSPGSGKTTVCKSVACRWYEETGGSVFHRQSSATKPFEAIGALEDSIRSARDPVLVVVEDAATPDTSNIYRLIERFGDADGVVFLLNAQHSAWQNPPEQVVSDARLQEVRSEYLENYTVPSITERECERAVEQFQSVTGRTVHQTTEQLASDLDTTEVGEMYLLAYRLASDVLTPDAASRAVADESTTVMDAAVKRVYNGLVERCDDDHLPLQLGVLINVLNAADIGIHPGLLHTLAESKDDHYRIDDLIDELHGELLFEGDGEKYRSHHTLWSSLFFRHFLETEGERRAADHFEEVVNALFETIDDADKRDRIQQWFRGEAEYVARIDDDPEGMADSFVLTVFNMGETDPKYAFARASGNPRQPIFHVAPLFSTTEYSRISIPEACSEETRLRCTNLRGVMYLDTGEFDRAKTEFEHLHGQLDELDSVSETRRTAIEAWTLNNLGNVARRQGELDDAESYHERSLERFREVDQRTGEAWTLNNIGNVYRLRGDLDTAESYHERSLDIFEELDNRLGKGWVRNNLGLVARIRGNLETAAERHHRSLEAFRDAGSQLGEARVLNALGLIARERGDYPDSLQYHRESMHIAREIGDRQCVAWCLNNLGRAHERAGDLEPARDRYLESLEVKRELGDQKGEANTLSNLATVAIRQGDVSTARERATESVDGLVDIRMYRDALDKLERFVDRCTERELDGAEPALREWCERGLDLADEHGLDEHRETFAETLSALDS